MRNLSIWAHYHPWKARFIIIMSSLLLTVIAILSGLLLYDAGYSISTPWTWLAIITIFLFCTIYPTIKNKAYKRYRFRKALDLSLATCSFVLFVFTSNQYAAPTLSVPYNNSLVGSTYAASFSKPIKPALKQQKRMAKQWLKAYRETFKKASPTTKALLIFLTVLVAIGLLILVAALSCSIACSSSEALALIVLLLGSTGVVLLGRMVIKRIRYGPKPEPKVASDPAL